MLDADAVINIIHLKKWVGSVPIRTQLVKEWVGPDSENTGSTPPVLTGCFDAMVSK